MIVVENVEQCDVKFAVLHLADSYIQPKRQSYAVKINVHTPRQQWYEIRQPRNL